jgi:hypothetical protein
VRLHHDRTTGREGGGGVAAGDGEREREVGRAKHRDGPDRAEHHPCVGLGERLAVGLREVDASVHPGSPLDEIGEKPELAAGARAFRLGAASRQTAFGHVTRDEFVAQGLDFRGDAAKECRAVGARFCAVGREGALGLAAGQVDLVGRGFVKGGFELFARGGVDGAKGLLGGVAGVAGEEGESGERRHGEIFDFGLGIFECGVRIGDCGVEIGDWGLRSADWFWIVVCCPWSVVCGRQSVVCGR